MMAHRDAGPTEILCAADWATTDAQEAARARIARLSGCQASKWRARPSLAYLLASTVSAGLGLWAPGGLLLGFLAFTGSAGLLVVGVVAAGEAATRDECETLEGFEVSLGEHGRHVTVGIWQGDALTGEDDGLLWFEEGRLYFSGRRTSFGLVPSQVRGRPRMRRGLTEDQVEIELCRDTAAGPMRLSFRLRPYARNADFAHRAAFRTELDAWAEGSVPGEGQFPPATLGPGLPTERRLLAEASLLTFPPAIAVDFLVATLVPGWGGTGLALGLSIFAGMVPAGNLRWRALRDRRRLRRAS